MTSLGRGFDSVAQLYDEARPGYPAELYDAIERTAGSLAGARVLDLAAGTGIASRALRERGARVVAIDAGAGMLQQARVSCPELPVVVAAAERLPVRPGQVDLVTCATGWHWLDAGRVVAEVRRVLRPGGHLALWWANHRWDDGIDWEDAQSAVYERWQTAHGSRPPGGREVGVRPLEAADDLRRRGVHVVVEQEFGWTRERTRAEHLGVIATHSDVIALGDRKEQFLAEVAAALAPWPTVAERLWGPLIIARV